MEYFLNIPKRYFIIFVVVFVFLLLAALISVFIPRIGKSEIKIVVAPPDAQILVNGKPESSRSVYVEDGEYTIEALREGFAEFKQVVFVEGEDFTLPIGMEPITEEAYHLVDRYNDIYLEIERLSGVKAQEEGENFLEEHPIVDNLPYRSLLFNIDYKLKNDVDFILVITADKKNRDFALAQIRNWGYNPKDFNVEYKKPD